MSVTYEQARASVLAGRTPAQLRNDWAVTLLIHGWALCVQEALYLVGADGLGYESQLVADLQERGAR